MCDSCQIISINGILCHEFGCPDSWKNKKHSCKECGSEFELEEKFEVFCSEHCYAMFNNIMCECDICLEFYSEIESEDDI